MMLQRKLLYKDRDGIQYPRWFVRLALALMTALYAVWAGYENPSFWTFSEQLYFKAKLTFYSIACVFIIEWLYYVHLYASRKFFFGKRTHGANKYILIVWGPGFFVPRILLNVAMSKYEQLPHVNITANLIPPALFEIIMYPFSLIMICFMASLAQQMIRSQQALKEFIIRAGVIAYMFYDDGAFYITEHNGTEYRIRTPLSFEEMVKKLDSDNFTAINDFTIVSREACKGIEEKADGSWIIKLEPPPHIPYPLTQNPQSLFSNIHWN